MKEKSPVEIIADLERVDVAPDVAEKISKAAALWGAAADAFVKKNRSLINLSSNQQARLLAFTIGHYEDIVRRGITQSLTQSQFDALVSFNYNSGHGWPEVRKAVNEGDYQAAALAMEKRIKSGGKVMQDLVKRRQREVDLLMKGHYGIGQ